MGGGNTIFHGPCGNGGIRPRPAIRIAIPECRIDGGGDERSIDRSWADGSALVDMWHQASVLTDSASGILMVIVFWICCDTSRVEIEWE